MWFSFFTKDMGVDLGTANTLIYMKGRGIVLNEPSVIAVNEHTKAVTATGKAAKEMIGKAPAHIRVVKPLQDGVISDFDMTIRMLKDYIRQVVTESSIFTTLRVVVGVPSGVTEVEKRAVEEVIRQMGAKHVHIMEEPMAAAIGTGLAVESPEGCMVADIGGGTSDIAIISLGGIVTSTSLRHAGDKLDDAIILYMRKNFDLLIGNKTAEEIKKKVGCAYLSEEDEMVTMEARGRDLLTGLPKHVEINSLHAKKALEEPIKIIIDGIKYTLEKAPPEIAADIVNNGLVLTGGGGLIRGMDKLVEKHTGLHVVVAENALEAVAEGTGKSLPNIKRLEKYMVRGKKK